MNSIYTSHLLFQSTPSVWRETGGSMGQYGKVCNFNPLPPCGGRLPQWFKDIFNVGISIHSLRVEGDENAMDFSPNSGNFNPLPPCGGRPQQMFSSMHVSEISIHSLRVEGDYQRIGVQSMLRYFNPLPPCGGRLYLL